LLWIRRATFVDICKRLNIKYDKAMCADSTEGIPNNKKAKNSSRGSRTIFSWLFAFIDSIEQQIPRPIDKKEGKGTILEKRKDILL
jgi:hypothetical protein